jgi:hypothetical protein
MYLAGMIWSVSMSLPRTTTARPRREVILSALIF